MRTFELPCLDGHKSFYKKAYVTEYDNGDKVLKSYRTNVMLIDTIGNYVRLWSGSSRTTNRHIYSFLQYYNIDIGEIKLRDIPVGRSRRV